MPAIDVVNVNKEKVETLDLPESVFGIEPNEIVVHEAVVMQMASQRQGTASTKTRGLVAGSGRKPWKQKGTGRARVGSIRSPIWRGGGIVFGPLPRSYKYRFPKKKMRLALCSVLSSKFTESSIVVIDALDLDSPKTKKASVLLEGLGLSGKVLIVADNSYQNFCLATRNMAGVKFIGVGNVNLFDVLNTDKMLITKEKIVELMEMLQ